VSSSWADGPLCGFDLETTGTDPETARIVSACVALDRAAAGDDVKTWLSDVGGAEIPAEAAAVHGITTERARAEGMPAARVVAEINLDLFAFGQYMPVVIYNAPFDLTVLDREIRRQHLHVRPPDRVAVIDPLVLDKHLDRYRRGSRKLADTCAHYGVRLDDAHDAAADTVAAVALARQLACRYPELAVMTAPELHELQVKAKADQAASFQDYLKRKGSTEIIDPSWPVIPHKPVSSCP
jgi:DNA polymerase III subunit epsilon